MLLLASLALAAQPPEVTTPLRSGSTAPADAAVIVSIEDYAFLADVPGAHDDAGAFYNALLYTRGIPAARIQTLRGANRDQILRAVGTARGEIGPGGTLWVYFTGHGATSSAGQPVLVGDDAKADLAVFEERSLPVTELEAALPPGAVVIVDASFAGVDRAGAPLIPGARIAVPTWALAGEGPMVWSAARTGAVRTYTPAGHGLFTWMVVGALRGWADGALDGAADGSVTAPEAIAWVERAAATLKGPAPVHTGTPPDGPWTTGRLEVSPPLAELPDVDGRFPEAARRPAVPGGITLPVVHDHGQWYADASGRLVHEIELGRMLSTAPDRRYTIARERIQGHRVANGLLLGGAVVTAGIGVASGTTYAIHLERYNAQFDDPTSDCSLGLSCEQKPEDALTSTVVMSVFTGLLLVPGIANVAAMPKLHRRAADAANQDLAVLSGTAAEPEGDP